MQLLTSALLAIVLLFGSGFACAKRVDSPGVPGSASSYTSQQQAELFLNRTLTSISETNLVIINSAVSANRSKLMNDAMTAKIVNYSEFVAETNLKVRAMVEGGRPWPERSRDALNLLRTLNTPPEIKAFLINPQTDVAIMATTQAIVLMQSLLQTAVIAAEGGK